MNIRIHNGNHLADVCLDYGLKPLASIVDTCRALLTSAHQAGKRRANIEFHAELLSRGYKTNPAMFGRTVAGDCPFPSVQSKMVAGYLCVVAGSAATPMTFRARAIHILTKGKAFAPLKGKVPPSYRRRPGLFASILSRELGIDIATVAKPDRIVWKRA